MHTNSRSDTTDTHIFLSPARSPAPLSRTQIVMPPALQQPATFGRWMTIMTEHLATPIPEAVQVRCAGPLPRLEGRTRWE